MKQETSLCNTVCLIIKLLRHHLIEIFELLFLQNLCVQSRNTVDRVACHDCQMCHLHLSIIDNCHLFDLLIVSRITILNFYDKSAVDLLNDLIDSRKQSGEQLNRPFFQSFCHDRMVRVSHGLSSNVPCLIPSKSFLIHQNTHQLSHSHSRMCIIHLECHFLIQLCDITVCLFVFRDRCLDAGRNEEILLFQTKFLACVMIIIGI